MRDACTNVRMGSHIETETNQAASLPVNQPTDQPTNTFKNPSRHKSRRIELSLAPTRDCITKAKQKQDNEHWVTAMILNAMLNTGWDEKNKERQI